MKVTGDRIDGVDETALQAEKYSKGGKSQDKIDESVPLQIIEIVS